MLIPDNRVIYVGKGHGERLHFHHKILARPTTKMWSRPLYRRLREVLTDGKSLQSRKVFETENELEALLHEQTLISHYGFENLVNVASHAFVGRTLKPEVGDIISSRLKEYFRSQGGFPQETRKKISLANTGRVPTQEHKENISRSKKGKPLAEGHRKSLKGLRRVFTPLWETGRQQAAKTLKAAWDSGTMTGSRGKCITFRDPEERARRISRAMKGKTISASTRAKIAKTLKSKHKSR